MKTLPDYIELPVNKLMTNERVKIYVLKSIMWRMIDRNIKLPKILIDEYKNIRITSYFKNDIYELMKKHNKNNEDLNYFIKEKYYYYKYYGYEKLANLIKPDIESQSYNIIVRFNKKKQNTNLWSLNYSRNPLNWVGHRARKIKL